jgi:hypothetical protein
MGNGMWFDIQLQGRKGWNAMRSRSAKTGSTTPISSSTESTSDTPQKRECTTKNRVGLSQASSQRMRWSSGRFQVLRSSGLSLLARGPWTGDIRYLGVSLPMAVPNPSLGVNLTLIGLAGAVLLAALVGGGDELRGTSC